MSIKFARCISSIIYYSRYSIVYYTTYFIILLYTVHTYYKSHYTGVFDLNFKLSLKRTRTRKKHIPPRTTVSVGHACYAWVGAYLYRDGTRFPMGIIIHEYIELGRRTPRVIIIIIIIFPSRQLNCVSCWTATAAGLWW